MPPRECYDNKSHSLTTGYDRPFSWTVAEDGRLSLKTEEVFSCGNPDSSSFFSSSPSSLGYRAGIEEEGEEVMVDIKDDGDGKEEGMPPGHAFTLARLEGRVSLRATSSSVVGKDGDDVEVDVESVGRVRRFTKFLDPRDENDGGSGDGEDVCPQLSLRGWTTGGRDVVVLGRRGRIGGWMMGAWEGARRVVCVYKVKGEGL